MAFLLINPRVLQNAKIYKNRVSLNDISEVDLPNYRLSRELIRQLVDEFAESPFSNISERNHAIPAETQVCVYKLQNKKMIYSAQK